MSLSAALSIFAPPSGLAPNGGEGASGDDGLFAGLMEATAVEVEINPAARATTSGRVAVDAEVPELPADDWQADAAPTAEGSPVPPTAQVAAPLLVISKPPVETTASMAPSPVEAAPQADAEPSPIAPPPETSGRAAATDRSDARTQTPVPTAPAPSTAPAKPAAAIGETQVPPPAESAATIDRPVTADPQTTAPPPVVAPSVSAKAQPSGLADPAMPSPPKTPHHGAGGTDVAREVEALIDPASKVDRSAPAETVKQAAVPAATLAGQASLRPPAASRTAVVSSGEAVPSSTIDPTVVKAARVPGMPVSVAPPPVAPALAAGLRTDNNAAVTASTPDVVPTPGSDRVAGEIKAVALATTVVAATPVARRPQAETLSPIPAEPATTPDTATLEGRVEPAPETPPATPAAVTASGLSRASIETTAILAAQIARRLEGRSTRFDMALTPEGLGRVDVRVEIDADGQLAARLAFDNPAAATELRGRADELRRQLEDAGFSLSRDALDFSEREPSSGGQGAFERQQRRAAYAHRLSSEPDLGAVPAAWSPHPGTPRGVDVKV